MNAPEGVKYSEQHIWVKLDGNLATLGITDFAQCELGDIVFVELPKAGSEIRAGDAFGSMESVKTVSDLYAPVSGKVIKVNESLEDKPGQINASPYEDGWLLQEELSDPNEIKQLWSTKQYIDTYGV